MICGVISRYVASNAIAELWIILLVTVIYSTPAFAAELRKIDIHHRDGRYAMNVETYLKAPVAAVYKILTDYDRFERIADAIKEARVLKNTLPDVYLVYTKVAACIALLCVEKEKIERIELRSKVEIFATVIPERSDFKYGVTQWIVAPEGKGTHLSLKVEIEPNFWLPPLIGPALIKAAMREQGANSVVTVERLANDILDK